MPYQVLARKYRPQTFEEVVGQEAIAKTLRNAIRENRIAHAYLFAGQRGVGKTSMARIFAKWLNCPAARDGRPCETCESCKRIALGEDVDVVEIDGASNRGIDQVREIRENVRYAPSRSPWKIYYIDEVHMLTTEAWNALLKTLEEPPPHVKFIFATTEAHRLPATILSRCQRFDFRPIPAARIEEHLTKLARAENVDCVPEAVAEIARRADGSMRDGETLLDQLISFSRGAITLQDVHDVLGTVSLETVRRTLVALASGDAASALAVVDEVLSAGKDVGEFLRQLVGALRDELVAKTLPASRPAGPSEEPAALRALSPDAILYMMNALSQLQKDFRRGNRDRAVVEMVLVKLARIGNLAPLSELVSRLDALRAGAREVPRVPERSPVKSQAPLPEGEATRAPVPFVDKGWEAVLAALKTADVRVHAKVLNAELARIEEDRIVLACSGWLAESLQEPAARAILEDCVEKGMGKRMKIDLVKSANNAAPPSSPAVPRTRPSAPPRDVHPLVKEVGQFIPGQLISRKGGSDG